MEGWGGKGGRWVEHTVPWQMRCHEIRSLPYNFTKSHWHATTACVPLVKPRSWFLPFRLCICVPAGRAGVRCRAVSSFRKRSGLDLSLWWVFGSGKNGLRRLQFFVESSKKSWNWEQTPLVLNLVAATLCTHSCAGGSDNKLYPTEILLLGFAKTFPNPLHLLIRISVPLCVVNSSHFYFHLHLCKAFYQ